MALYRKYRPATFADVVGQEHVTEPLSTALAAGRINHAYLFSGPRGCGKTSSARILARSLNCEQGPTPTPCGVCDSCVALAPNGPGSVDVVELDAASHGGVDDTRELRDRAFYAPAQSRYRIFIIDEAHMVTHGRLQRAAEDRRGAAGTPDLRVRDDRAGEGAAHHPVAHASLPVPAAGARGPCGPLLERICAQEDVTVDDAVYPLVIRAGGGSPRDTLSVLDQLLAGSETGEAGNHISYQRALALLGATDVALIDVAVDALAAGDAAAVFGAVEAVIDAGHDPRRFATDLLERFRDLIVLQSVPDAVARGVVDGPEDVLERMRDQATRIGTATLTRYAEVVHAGLGEMRGATAPRLLLEVVCARLLLPSASDTEAALLQRIERIETRLDVSIPASDAVSAEPVAPPKQYTRKTKAAEPSPPKSEPEPEPKPEPERAPEPEAVEPKPASPPPVRPPSDPVVEAPPPAAVTGEPNAAAVRSMWTTVREKVRQRSRTTEVMLAGAIVRAVEGDTLVLSHESAPLAKRLSEQRNADVIREALKDALGVDWKIRCEAGAASAPAPVADDAPVPPAQPQRDEEEESMLAEASSDNSEAPRRDPEEAALELLQNELGARRIDGS